MRKELVLNLYKSPSHLLRRARDTQKLVEIQVNSVNETRSLDEILNVMDGISDKLCILTDSSECIRRLHPDPKWKEAADEAFENISSLMIKLNSDKGLASHFSNFAKDHVFGNEQEKDSVIESLQRDFELFALIQDEKQNILKLNEEMEKASIEFEGLKTIKSLERMIRLRFEFAKALGFKTPLDLGLRDKQLNSFCKVMEFLRNRRTYLLKNNNLNIPSKIFVSTTMNKIVSCLTKISKDLFSVQVKLASTRDFSNNLSFKFEIYDSLNFLHLGTILFDFTGKDLNPTHYTIKCRKWTKSSGLVLISVKVKDFESVSYGESKSIFHEFGHALHSILCETRYQVLSGTRGPVDLAEIPSTLFELIHDSEQVQNDLKSRNEPWKSVDLELLRGEEVFQLQISALDQLLHHQEPVSPNWSRDLAHEIEKEFTSIEKEFTSNELKSKPRDWHASISHLATYGGNYFAYPFSKSVAERAYNLIQQSREGTSDTDLI